MLSSKKASSKSKPLLIFAVILAVGVASFFIYKYAYIYTERKKYDTATIAIQKVADDLRAQGIETEFSKGCGRTQEVYSNGTLFCNVILKIKDTNPSERVFNLLSSTLKSSGYNLISMNGVNVSENYRKSGIISYSFKQKNLSCGLRYYEAETQAYFLSFSCGSKSNFKLF